MTNHLFLTVVATQRFFAFPTPAADFMIFISWIWSLAVFGWPCLLFFSVAELWLLSSHTFLFLQWLGFAFGAIFQSASHMWCSKLLWELSEEDPLCSGHTILEFKVLSSEKKCRNSRWQCQVVPQHHGPPICFTISECRVGANHPNHSIYTFFGLIVQCDKLCFPLSSIFINYFLVIHHSQAYNSHFVLSDIADYGKPAIECTLCCKPPRTQKPSSDEGFLPCPIVESSQ